MRKVILRGTILAIFICLPACVQSASSPSIDAGALNLATQSLCSTHVAMLGESATHGDGHTVAFKAALIERLIDQCGFDSILFEASHYEFLHLNRQLRLGRSVTPNDLLSAVGGLWEFDREFQPLAAFLVSKAQTGQVFLGGLDDQLGQFGQDYANIEMVTELTNLLPQPDRQTCSALLHQRIYSDYTDAPPYSNADRSSIETCLSEIDKVSASDKKSGNEDREERQEMISAAQRWIHRDFTSGAESIVGRDRSMFQNFEWLQSHQPKPHKVIVWAATVHIAKQGNPAWGDRTGTNFGSFIHSKYGKYAFSLGFSALAGSYRQGGRDIREMPTAPSDSVESLALRSRQVTASFIGSAQLAAMETRPGAFFQHSYQTLPWFTFLDGVVVFPSEYPPSDIRQK